MAARRRSRSQPTERAKQKRISRQKRQDNMQPAIIGVVGLVLLVGGFLAIRGMGGANAAETKPAPPPPTPVEYGNKNTRAKDVETWIEALHQTSAAIAADPESDGGAGAIMLAKHSDSGALSSFLGITGDEKAVIRELATGTKTEEIRFFDLSSVGMPSKDDATGDQGAARANFSLTGERKKHYLQRKMSVDFKFRMSEGRYLVTGWTFESKPEKAKLRKSFKVETDIAKATKRTVTINGEEQTVYEAETVALDHLEDTPPEVRTKIDGAIATIRKFESPAQVNAARDVLYECGRPSMPRLLNALHEIKVDDAIGEELVRRIQVIRNLLAPMELLTGQRFPYDVRLGFTKEEAVAAEELRKSTVKRWFAWWRVNGHAADWDKDVDKSDGLDLLKTDK